MRGVAFIAAVSDFSRFDNPRQLMAFLGLLASEHSSGATIRRGNITKAGNALAKPASVASSMTVTSACLKLPRYRLEGPVRLCARYRRLSTAGKPKVTVTTAIARRWSAACGRSLVKYNSGRPPAERCSTISVRRAGGRARSGILVACYEPALPTLAP
ncbi:transposase [Bradyrhizobium sp. CIR18]|nr:transposase [Bradyrhizobium sp. CIR18]MBB4367132.1 transposase [Bradyrhizobium sp. CIR18]